MKTKYDWSNVPKEVNWIATDPSGIKCNFKSKPYINNNGWEVNNVNNLADCVFDFAYAEEWQDSLEERPK